MKMKEKLTSVFSAAISLIASVPVRLSKKASTDGNSLIYSVASTKPLPNSPLKGKTVIFLGSSVTFGSASKGESFVEFLAKRDGIKPVKEAVSGTTLVDNGPSSYISRMKTIDKNIKADAFICQLSTNDANVGFELGNVSDSFSIEDFDTSAIAGAIEYIITYARETWKCPVIFYTGTKFDSEKYAEMVDLLLKIQKKHKIGVIDLWNNEMNSIDREKYDLYMANGVHPKRAGYREWWTPEMEKFLYEYLYL